MDCSAFAGSLREAILGAWQEFRERHPAESPYAFAIIEGQCGDYLGYAIATEEGLQRACAEYERRGYRYQGWGWEDFDNRERLAAWLRWANPDDGWHYGDFPESYGVQQSLRQLVESGAFGEDAEDLEEFCTEVLASLQSDPRWRAQPAGRGVIVGVTSGEDPRNFLRTGTRANPYSLVQKLWQEYWQGEELSARMPPPGSGPA